MSIPREYFIEKTDGLEFTVRDNINEEPCFYYSRMKEERKRRQCTRTFYDILINFDMGLAQLHAEYGNGAQYNQTTLRN